MNKKEILRTLAKAEDIPYEKVEYIWDKAQEELSERVKLQLHK